ncbi:hypothetical protein KI387_040853 [Taxus chinensis]|uniref:Uncharacterized protein n=1 Tax=Taxus chinensis TaxID=29808 RepID=A0AA38CAP7_TAXCH|nr:hypothetical protein KI387_040853 [Taxus chinensis]
MDGRVYFDSSNVPDINNNGSNSISWKNISEADNGGPLYHMNTLADTLPCKRGLSSFYDGKSQSFSCLADVKCGEDLAKPEDSYYRKKNLKRFQSWGLRFNVTSYQLRISSDSIISKRPRKASKMMVSKSTMKFVMSTMSPVSPTKRTGQYNNTD